MSEHTDKVRIVVSESDFACIENAVARMSPVRNAVERASQHGRQSDNVDVGNKVVITCSEAEAEEGSWTSADHFDKRLRILREKRLASNGRSLDCGKCWRLRRDRWLRARPTVRRANEGGSACLLQNVRRWLPG